MDQAAGELITKRRRLAARIQSPADGPQTYLGWTIIDIWKRSKPLADIAELAGYQSVSAFSTAFRRRTGEVPTAYLRSAGQPS